MVGIFSKWPPVKVVFMFYTFGKINKSRALQRDMAVVIFSEIGGGGQKTKLPSIFYLTPDFSLPILSGNY